MSDITKLLDANKAWAERIKQSDPDFFTKLAEQQRPEYLWIGCSDSRVPANQIVGLLPGEIFVHRNVANMVVHTDLNCLSVIQFAVDVLKVKHIIVTGHYGCGGVMAAMHNKRLGQIDNWLRHVKDVRTKHKSILERFAPEMRATKLCELNVIEQVMNVCETSVVQDAWARRQPLTVNGWIYKLEDGIIRDLGISTKYPETLWDNYEMALKSVMDSKAERTVSEPKPVKIEAPAPKVIKPVSEDLFMADESETRAKYTIFCDGGCKPNPGAGAWAAIVRGEGKERELSGGEPQTTNNRMELTAVTRALEAIKKPSDVTIVVDSEYVANAFRQKWLINWKRNGWKTSTKEPVKNKDLWEVLDALIAKHHVTWEWTRGHSGHPENERCDVLASETRRKMFGV